MDQVSDYVKRAFSEHSGKITAMLIGQFGDFDLAEDALQDAFVSALEHWQLDGLPANPGGWLMLTAKRKALDRLRRMQTLNSKLARIYESMSQDDAPQDVDSVAIPDEQLKLMFTCCHPALSQDAQIALTLRTLAGLSTEEISRAFLVPVPTMAQRLVRAKRKIASAAIPYRVPSVDILPERLNSVLLVIYLVFNEGYAAGFGSGLIRHDLCREAIRLGRVLIDLLAKEAELKESPEALGLLALMLLQHARRDARIDQHGHLVVLEEQDRTLWDQAMIAEGLALLERATQMVMPGIYQLQAAINAVHAQASHYDETDWRMIASLYRELYKLNPSPVVNLNWAVALAMVEGYEYGLKLIDRLCEYHHMENYVPLHAARAELLRRNGQMALARKAYQRALDLSQNATERAHFQRRLRE